MTVTQQDFLHTKFGHHLSAGAAGGNGCVGIGNDDGSADAFGSLADGGADRDAFGTVGEAKGKILDVAATDECALGRFDAGTDVKMRIRRVGMIARFPSDVDEW